MPWHQRESSGTIIVETCYGHNAQEIAGWAQRNIQPLEQEGRAKNSLVLVDSSITTVRTELLRLGRGMMTSNPNSVGHSWRLSLTARHFNRPTKVFQVPFRSAFLCYRGTLHACQSSHVQGAISRHTRGLVRCSLQFSESSALRSIMAFKATFLLAGLATLVRCTQIMFYERLSQTDASISLDQCQSIPDTGNYGKLLSSSEIFRAII